MDSARAGQSIATVLTGPTFSTREIYNADRNAVPRVIEERRSGGVSSGKGPDMAASVREANGGNVLEVTVSGKLTQEDYQHFVPAFERLVKEHGKIRVLFEMADFHGWQAGALWADIKFDLKHFSHIERLAMVGDKKWEQGMAAFCRPFTTAEVQYFDGAALQQARAWLAGKSA
jgi:SpoIIAA-like